MAQKHHTPSVSKKAVEDAQNFWQSFTAYSKWATISIVLILIILAAAFIDW